MCVFLEKCVKVCHNGGECVFDSNDEQVCQCLEGFEGESCERGEHAQSVFHNPLSPSYTTISASE